VKLLLDQNLLHRILELIERDFPGSAHVRDHSLQSAADEVIWRFAKDRSLAIVSKDDDFAQRSLLLGHPPKVVWIRLGNCSTREVATLLLQAKDDVLAFDADNEQSLMVITPDSVLRR
jgi:predicted nuclease of predicted toxin-antitoxin system